MQLPGHVIAAIHDIVHAVGPRSDGGRKVTVEEAEQILLDLEKIGEDIAAMLAAHQVYG